MLGNFLTTNARMDTIRKREEERSEREGKGPRVAPSESATSEFQREGNPRINRRRNEAKKFAHESPFAKLRSGRRESTRIDSTALLQKSPIPVPFPNPWLLLISYTPGLPAAPGKRIRTTDDTDYTDVQRITKKKSLPANHANERE